MQCIILAGGLGTRMHEISGSLPKALLPVGPQTFIDWQLQWLKLLGVTEVVLALGYHGEEIQAHVEAQLKKGLYPKMKYRFDGKEYLGTGGAIRNIADLLANDFLVTYGDSFLVFKPADLYTAHLQAKRGVTFSIYHNKGSGDTSNVIYRNGAIVKYDKVNLTSDMEYIDYGMLAINKTYFLANTPVGKFDLAPFLSKTCDKGQMTSLVADEKFREIGSPRGYQEFCEFMAANKFDLLQVERKLQ